MNNEILLGECSQVLKEYSDNHFDTVITDPPYALGFMGEKWDGELPPIDTFKEILRVAKPGATMLCFGGSRTYHRLACNIEDAGWKIIDTLHWFYGEGMSHSQDISKMIDKELGLEREVVGQNTNGSSLRAVNSPYKNIENKIFNITAPTSEQSKLWDGWKTCGFKPAFEPIIVAQKQNDGTYANNALKWGVSGFWVDGSRIGTKDNLGRPKGEQNDLFAGFKKQEYMDNTKGLGRYPANIILSCYCESNIHEPDCPVFILDDQVPPSKSSRSKRGGVRKNKVYGKYDEPENYECGFEDEGGPSRFFYCVKAKKSERMYEEGFKHSTVKPIGLFKYLCNLTKTPTSGIVLDPFSGSGTTAVAAMLTGRDSVSIEKEKEYFDMSLVKLEKYKKEVK